MVTSSPTRHQAISPRVAEETSNEAQQLHRAVGLGHVVVAPGGARFFLVALHRKRAHSDDWYRLKIRVDFNQPGGLVAVDHWHQNVHKDEVGPVGFGLGDAVQRKPERKAARISSKVAKMALAALRKAIDESGEIPPACNHIPAKKNTVSIKCWRRWFYHADGADTVEAKRKNFRRGREALQAEGCVGWAPEKGGEEDIQCWIIS